MPLMSSPEQDNVTSILTNNQELEELQSGGDIPQASLCSPTAYKDEDTGLCYEFYANSVVLGWLHTAWAHMAHHPVLGLSHTVTGLPISAISSNGKIKAGSCMIQCASENRTDMGVQNGSCLGAKCQYGWDFSSCREQGSCLYGLSNHYEPS
nr:uncharacterized protein LOC129012578 isoform X2 [Pongo pygmaeus]